MKISPPEAPEPATRRQPGRSPPFPTRARKQLPPSHLPDEEDPAGASETRQDLQARHPAPPAPSSRRRISSRTLPPDALCNCLTLNNRQPQRGPTRWQHENPPRNP